MLYVKYEKNRPHSSEERSFENVDGRRTDGLHNTISSPMSLRLRRAKINIKVSSFKISENIRKKEDGPDRFVSNNKFSSMTMNKPVMKARDRYCKA